jgi:hypothetical protein
VTDPKPTKRPKLYVCKVCRNKYEKGVIHANNPLASWCSVECATKLALKKLEQNKVKAISQGNREWKERKKGLKQELTGGKQTNDPLQQAINKLVRLLDNDLPCLARPTEQSSHFDSGHVYGVGSFPSLRYNLWNIHKQSTKSNRDLGGESLLMLDGLADRYGQERVEFLKNLRIEYRELHLTPQEKEEALKRTRELIRRVEKGEYMTRDFANKYIGIYG